MTDQILMVAGFVWVVVGLGALANGGFFRRAMGSFTETPSLIFVTGVVNLVIGLFMVMNHNRWETWQESLVSFIGFAALFRGVLMILSPKMFLRLFKRIWLGSHLKGEAFFLFVVGVILIYMSM
jgi:hypothetical protein